MCAKAARSRWDSSRRTNGNSRRATGCSTRIESINWIGRPSDLKLTDRESNVREGSTITLGFIAQDKWKFTARDRLLYSYRIDQLDWSAFRSETDRPGEQCARRQHDHAGIHRAGQMEIHGARPVALLVSNRSTGLVGLQI